MRTPFLILLTFLGASSAFADCRTDAFSARDRLQTSGPYGYEREMWIGKSRWRECGAVEPGRAEHQYPCEAGPHYQAAEKIIIDNVIWENDGLGWFHAGERSSPRSFKIPASEDTHCLGLVTEGGHTLEHYLFVTRDKPSSTESLFVDPTNGLPVRVVSKDSINSVTAYTYDPSIRIETPDVDLEKRRLNSLARFEAAVNASDPQCRAKFFDAVERSRKVSFVFSIWSFVTHDGGTTGHFMPPFSVLLREHTIGEAIPVTVSRYAAEDPWAGGMYDEAKLPPGLKYFRSTLMPLPDEVGSARCTGRISLEGREYDVIEYDSYYFENKSSGSEGPPAKILSRAQRMLIDPDRQLPARVQEYRPGQSRIPGQDFVDTARWHF